MRQSCGSSDDDASHGQDIYGKQVLHSKEW